MVIAGIRNRKTQGEMTNNASMLANPLSRTFESVGRTHMKMPILVKKTVIAMYPIRELRKTLISFCNR
jgi:hypothetical protein